MVASINLADLNGSNGFVIKGICEHDLCGFSVSNAGDIKDDGIDDLIIGRRCIDSNGNNRAGESHVVFGANNQGINGSFKLSALADMIWRFKKTLSSLLKGKRTANDTEPQIFQVRTQLLSKGRSDYTLASTEAMSIRIKCYATGGENVLHTHPGQDHTFIVLAGKAKFYGIDGEVTELIRNQGILIPEGFYHYFSSCGEEALVMLRIAAEKRKVRARRIGIDGKPFSGKSQENNYEEKVPIEGRYYE